jgi:tetratricopeptide (TPR) repeat protein
LRKHQWDRALADSESAKRLAGTDKYLTLNCLQTRSDVLAMTGRLPQAEAGYQECLKLAPERATSVLVSQAWFVDRPRGDYDSALQKLDEAAKSEMIRQFLDRGRILVRLGQPDRALADFREVLERVKSRRNWFAIPDYLPRWLALMLGRGEAYLLKGDLDRALADSDEAVRFAPHSAEARLLRARVHDRRGKPDLADADRRQPRARLDARPARTAIAPGVERSLNHPRIRDAPQPPSRPALSQIRRPCRRSGTGDSTTQRQSRRGTREPSDGQGPLAQLNCFPATSASRARATQAAR